MSGSDVRLLVCLQCKTIDEVPDYEGDPRYDSLLEYVIRERHEDRTTGTRHVGNLLRVPAKVWQDSVARKSLLDKINEGLGGGETGLGTPFYNARDTFSDDAMVCFRKHLSPTACSEYKADHKEIAPWSDIKETYKDAGLARPKGMKKHYLCEFCPVHSNVLARLRQKAGLYE